MDDRLEDLLVSEASLLGDLVRLSLTRPELDDVVAARADCFVLLFELTVAPGTPDLQRPVFG